jgi:hypothetical protein
MSEPEIKHAAPKRIDFEAGTFQANGKTYTIEGALSIERYAEFQILEKEMAYGYTVESLFKKFKELWDNSNKLKFAENAVLLHDLMKGVTRLGEREPVVLKICALFINTDDEDRGTISRDRITAKIKDWKAENMDIRDFFQLASSTVNGFLKIYDQITREFSTLNSEPAE